MISAYDLIVSTLVAASISIALKSSRVSTGVSIKDEYKAQHVPINKKEKMIFTLAGTVACMAAAYIITGKLHLAVLAAVGGIAVGNVLIKRKLEQKNQLLKEQYTNALIVLTTALQGGKSPYAALEDGVPSMPSPSREVFSEILQRTRTGYTYTEATYLVAKQTGWNDLKSLGIALDIYDRTGCNLVEVFNYLVGELYERNSDKKYVQAMTSQVRSSALILSLLPFVLMGAIRIMSPEYAQLLFGTPSGNIVILSCAAMVIIGNIFIGKMIVKTLGN